MASRIIHQIRVPSSLPYSLAMSTKPLLPPQPDLQHLESLPGVTVFPGAVWHSLDRFRFLAVSYEFTRHICCYRNCCGVLHKCYGAFVQLHLQEDLQNRFLPGLHGYQRLHIYLNPSDVFLLSAIEHKMAHLAVAVSVLLNCSAACFSYHLQLLQDRCSQWQI